MGPFDSIDLAGATVCAASFLVCFVLLLLLCRFGVLGSAVPFDFIVLFPLCGACWFAFCLSCVSVSCVLSVYLKPHCALHSLPTRQWPYKSSTLFMDTLPLHMPFAACLSRQRRLSTAFDINLFPTRRVDMPLPLPVSLPNRLFLSS